MRNLKTDKKLLHFLRNQLHSYFFSPIINSHKCIVYGPGLLSKSKVNVERMFLARVHKGNSNFGSFDISNEFQIELHREIRTFWNGIVYKKKMGWIRSSRTNDRLGKKYIEENKTISIFCINFLKFKPQSAF